MLKKLKFAVLLFIPFNVLAAEYSIIIDRYESPYAGASYMQSIYTGYKALDDKFLRSSAGKETFLWRTGRTGKFVVEYYLSIYPMLVQHEIFGHGYRGRELGLQPLRYSIGWFSGSTSFSGAKFNALNFPQQAAVAAGGMEADTILAEQIRAPWFTERKLDYRDGIFFWQTTLDQPNYVLGTKEWDTSPSNDVNRYIGAVNSWYGANVITKSELKTQQIWNLLDPTIYYSLYAMGHYIWTGQQNVKVPMFNIRGYDYLPTPRLLLAPYGSEFQLQNHIVTPRKQYIRASLRYGSNSYFNSYGIDVLVTPIYQYKRWNFGGKLFVWRQPDFYAPTARTASNMLGAAAYASAEYKFNKCWYGLSELGYKTQGFIQGEPLGYGWVWRLGVKLKV